MGCDIHMYTEVKRTIENKEQWVNVDNYRVDPYEPGRYEHKNLHGGRNYSLFTLLAGVRDYSEKTVPVSDPKGLPADMSPQTKEAAERWEGDGHTHSYLTLNELKAFQAGDPVITYTGLLNRQQRNQLDAGALPNSWCQGTNQPDHERRTWNDKCDDLIPLIEKMEKELRDQFWLFDSNYDKAMDEKIRIVFWFDN